MSGLQESIKSWDKGENTHDIQQIGYRKLRMLNKAVTLDDLRIPPANRLEKLNCDRAGQYSTRINDQWRICFEWSVFVKLHLRFTQ